MGEKICISDLTLDALTAYIVGLGQPKFRAKQIFKWLHQKLVTEFSQMTDQPKALLAQLEEQCTIAAPVIRRRQQSRDGTVKYLLQLADGNCIETVLMRYKYGNTVCVSTQVGCAMGCRFCASTQAGRVRGKMQTIQFFCSFHTNTFIIGSSSPDVEERTRLGCIQSAVP